jgi:starch phosphorylase
MGMNGWAIPPVLPDVDPDAADGEHLYALLEEQVTPMYYRRDERGLPIEWIQRMKQALRVAGEQFDARRMVREYVNGYYLPAFRGETPPTDPPV